MESTLRFLLNGERVEQTAFDPHQTLLDFLREQRRLTGTKEGCNEGDCGACTVVLGELTQDGAGQDRVSLTPINACIRLLATLDGKAVFTVESLRAASGALHPTQQALVDCHGSQCGFCTPGFVMSLFALFKTNASPTRDETCEAISGNLCRCTGYRPMLDAAQVMYQRAADSPAISACDDLSKWMFTPATEGDALLPGEAELAARLKALAHSDALRIESSAGTFIAPHSVDEFSAAVLAHPNAWILGGGTDIGLWITKALQTSTAIIYTGEVNALKRINETDAGLRIGAAVALEPAFRAMNRLYPELAHVWTRFASKPIRASGTLGGNVANGSPIGDSMSALIAIGAQVVLRQGDSERIIPLEALYLDYKKQAREPGEWVEAIIVPRREPGALQIASYKNSKRNEQDISAVFCAIALGLERGVVVHIRIAFGGMAGIPKRALNAENAILGKAWSEASVRAAMQVLSNDFAPVSDMRASSEYRMQVAQNHLLRFWLESQGGAVTAPVRVF